MEFANPEETKQKLISFEERISDLYKNARIRAPVHLAGGNEDQVLEIFKQVSRDDWIFSSYRSHYHALLKGMPEEKLEEEIVRGHSMHISSKEHKIYTTSIVPGQLSIALGTALALKLRNSENRVWAFCGDMASETGEFSLVTKYARNHNLPITFVVEDDGLSVYTPTREVWGIREEQAQFSVQDPSVRPTPVRSLDEALGHGASVIRYRYDRKWPHHGIGLWVEFPEEQKRDPAYKSEVKKSMRLLADDPNTLFIGQTAGYKGSAIFETLEGIADERRIEVPIMEEVQMGMSIGLGLEGFVPISIYPRFDFLTLATNQMVNHLDKAKELSNGEFAPRVIVRTMIGSRSPLYPGPQHCQDHTEAYRKMLENMNVTKIERSGDVIPAYKEALASDKSSLMVEVADLY